MEYTFELDGVTVTAKLFRVHDSNGKAQEVGIDLQIADGPNDVSVWVNDMRFHYHYGNDGCPNDNDPVKQMSEATV